MQTNKLLEAGEVQSLLNAAIEKQQASQLDEAESIYRQVLQIQPEQGVKRDALNRYSLIAINGLGNVLQQQGNLEAAAECYQQAIELNPSYAEAHNNLGNIFMQQHRLGKAAESYRQALKLKPDLAEAHNNWGIVLSQQGHLEAAAKSYQQAINLKPDFARAYYNLGNILKQQGHLEAAVESYRKANQLEPDFAEIPYHLGNIFKQQGQLEQAAEFYQQALKLKPDLAEAHNNLGNIFKQQGQIEKAIASYRQAIEFKPNFVEAYFNLGNVLKQQERLSEAVQSYTQALKLKPDYFDAYLNIGNVLKQQNRLEAAIESYRRALWLKPDPEVYCNLGNALGRHNQVNEAIEAFNEALNLEPKCDRARFGILTSQFPVIYASIEEIEGTRRRYQHYLQELAQHYQTAPRNERARAAEAVGSSQPFYLAYQGLNDRQLQQIYGEMICQLMASRYPQWSQPLTMPPLASGEKIRVGFVCGFFYAHSVWKIPLRGWVENLDRNQFEVIGFYTGSKQDRETEIAAQACHKFVRGPLGVEEWCEAIAGERLHVLIFPEFGMDPMTVSLGCLRLAPRQVAFGGHPETSGLPTIDYHLSSDLMEPENAQDHYTEKLVRLPNLAIYYTPVDITPTVVSRSQLGIDPDDIMFWCCQSLYKYLPQHDDVFPRIAKELPKSQFVFIRHESKQVTEVFCQRLKATFQAFGLDYQDHCKLLPRLGNRTFAGTAAVADIFLDSIGWSGNNSTMESVAYNLPVVTCPGELMRSRHVKGILTMMGIEETIASSKEEYVQIAVRLGRDSQYHQAISAQVAQNKHKLYRDTAPIGVLEDFLLNLVHQKE